ncbi:DUF1569 domain-containing protein [uncultured Algibacter sp.]|uniref:DUF1569 domain-containing protein n=1 Tax=uncultured Algibacter sp. TaxID=298659 RepID=UPI003216E521
MEQPRIKILNQLLSQIEKNIPNKTLKNNAVSKSDIGWQLDHSLKVINAVCANMIKTNPDNFIKDFNLLRSILFSLGYLPRGRAKAPKVVLPPDIILKDNLYTQINTAVAHLKQANELPEKSYFKHHVFGMLSKQQTLRFLEIHTKHHLKIIDDILKNQKTLSVSRKGS